MLSAATAALLAVPVWTASAATTISASKDTAQDTTTDGDITIDANGAISIKAAKAAVTINSNNFVNNAGTIANTDTSDAVGVQITTNATTPLLSPSGFVNSGSLELTGDGTSKVGIWVTGGGSFVGPIDLASSSVMQVSGDSGAFFKLDSGTTINGDVTLSGSMTQTPSKLGSTTSSSGIGVDVEGNINGNFVIDSASALSSIGAGARGVNIIGNINPCDSATGAVCAATPEAGVFYNGGAISVNGVQFPSRNLPNPESGTALSIGGNVAGGIYNAGPTGGGSTIVTATISGNGSSLPGSSAIAPVVVISPTVQTVSPNVPMTIGVYTGDSADPGFSFYNRGTITGTPVDPNLSVSTLFFNGSSKAAGLTLTGGIFNSGSIAATTGTNTTDLSSIISSTALTIGSYVTAPNLTVSAEAIGGVKTTQGSITASVSGIGGGVATAVSIAPNASLPEIDVQPGGVIAAQATTPVPAPTAPITLEASAITDASGSLVTVNNAGSITAGITILTPSPAVTNTTVTQAINLAANTTGGQVINNSGTIIGNVIMGTVGNGDTINVGNIGAGGAPNTAPGMVTNTSTSMASITGSIGFGSGGTIADPQRLHVGAWGSVTGPILSDGAVLDVQVDKNGLINVQNTTSTSSYIAATGSLAAHNFDVNGGTLAMTIAQSTGGAASIITASNEITVTPDSKMEFSFGSFISSADPLHPAPEQITLLSAPTLTLDQTTVDNFNGPLAQNLPFLFESNPGQSPPLSLGTSGANHTLVLTLLPKSPGATNADGTPGLGLTGDALSVYPKAVQALTLDPQLGAAIASGVTNSTTAQSVFSQLAPDVSGGSRAVAILITDQATGPVAARQRFLRAYGDQPGQMTIWTQEYVASIDNKGLQSASGDITKYKDHGFGFALGMDAGSAANGWYGGALSFYAGDIDESAPRDSQTEAQWYMLTGYTDWHGKHLFLDTQATIGYGSLLGKRTLVTPSLRRQAEGKRAGLLGALGATTGAIFNYGSLSVTPHIGLDAMAMREDGYAENNGGDGLDLTVAPYYANSLRANIGTDVAENIDLGDFSLKPELRLGYRYDFLADPVKLKAGFTSFAASTQTNALSPANRFTLTGPDPEKGDIVGGAGISALAGSWSLSLNYDWVRGGHGSTSQVATFSMLGRI
jgi:hypothetical protein